MEIAWSLRDALNTGGLSRLIIHKKPQCCGFIDGVSMFAAPTCYLVCATLSDTQRSINVRRYNLMGKQRISNIVGLCEILKRCGEFTTLSVGLVMLAPSCLGIQCAARLLQHESHPCPATNAKPTYSFETTSSRLYSLALDLTPSSPHSHQLYSKCPHLRSAADVPHHCLLAPLQAPKPRAPASNTASILSHNNHTQPAATAELLGAAHTLSS